MTMGIGLMLSVIGVLIASRVVPELDLLTTSSFFVAEFVSYPLIGICATATLVGADYPSSVRGKLQPLIARLAMIVIMFAVGGLTVRSLGDSTEFIVADRGPGIAQEERHILFSPFRQKLHEELTSTPGQGDPSSAR